MQPCMMGQGTMVAQRGHRPCRIVASDVGRPRRRPRRRPFDPDVDPEKVVFLKLFWLPSLRSVPKTWI